jgi:hypothetical protein
MVSSWLMAGTAESAASGTRRDQCQHSLRLLVEELGEDGVDLVGGQQRGTVAQAG